jgi:hypothetical protein
MSRIVGMPCWGSPRLTDTLIADLRVLRRGCLYVEDEEALHAGLSA